ncbi:MAG: hypothetical protein ACT4PL_01650 [Phycisphaerales bacterium]
MSGNGRPIEEECRVAVQRLRGALIELYSSVGTDPTEPQEVSRRFGLNKNLTWKVSRVIGAPDPFTAVQHIPGGTGLEILLTALSSKGAPDGTVDGVRRAMAEFDRVVDLHAGDRAALDLILDSSGLGRDVDRLQVSREKAFSGNSGIWGVQARTRVTCGFLCPVRDDPSSIVAGLVGGFCGFQRLRREVRWPLFRFTSYDHHGQQRGPAKREGELPHVLREFSSPELPDISCNPVESGVEYVLNPGPVGRLSAFNCFFERFDGKVPRYKTKEDERGEFASMINLPIQTFIFDVIAHRDIGPFQPPEVLVYGRPAGGTDTPTQWRGDALLPLPERCMELVGSPPVVHTPHIPRYSEVVTGMIQRLGFDPGDFIGWRLQMEYPPMPSTVVLRWPLPEAPGGK